MSLDSFQPSVLIHPLSSPLPLKLPFPHHWSVSTHFYVLGLQMTRTVLLRKKDKKIYSLQTSFYKFTSQPLRKSCQFPYNLPISFCKLTKSLLKVPGMGCIVCESYGVGMTASVTHDSHKRTSVTGTRTHSNILGTSLPLSAAGPLTSKAAKEDREP